MRSVIVVCSIVLFLGSCNKDDGYTYSGPQLSRILSGNVVQTEFSYDTKGRLSKTTTYFLPGIPGSETIRYYDDNGRLVKQENAFNVSSSSTVVKMDRSYTEYSYDTAGRLIEGKTYRLSGSSVIYANRSVPDYDAQGRTIAMANYDPSSGIIGNKTTYQYNSAGNVAVEEFYQNVSGSLALYWHTEHEYDQQKNPYQGKWVMPYGVNKNNITKTTGTTYPVVPGSAAGTGTHTITYKKYNTQGYPTLVNENGADYVYEYR